MKRFFSRPAGQDYRYWQRHDSAIARRIEGLLEEISRTPRHGSGKPLELKHALAGYASRRIAGEHRLVYRVRAEGIEVAQCRYHYE